MSEAFYEYFAHLFERSKMLNHGESLQHFLDGDLCPTVQEAECCEGQIPAKEVMEVL